jgi:zinc/manganese transport system substrate-binding protein
MVEPRPALVALMLLLSVTAAGCATAAAPGSTGTTGGRLLVVAAENVWGSLAAQLGGNRVAVTSIITKPGADPHDYEPTAADARLFADAGIVIVNGIGYDPWTERLIDANPVAGRVVLNVGHVVGVPVGGNPHQWYSPASVRHVIDAIAGAFGTKQPADRAYFEAQRRRVLDVALEGYFDLIARIQARFSGTPVGASESIFEPMAPALGLDLITPPGFLKAISEGTDPTSADTSTADAQIRDRRIHIYVYNSQNATPDVQRQVAASRAEGIPVATITETLVPEGATFQAWQVRQLAGIAAALRSAGG